MTPAEPMTTTAPHASLLRRPEVRRPHALARAVLPAVGVGVLTRTLLGDGFGLGFPLWVGLLVGGFAFVGGREAVQRARGSRGWVLAALFFAAAVGLRESPSLVALNVLATTLLLLLAAHDALEPTPRTRLVDFFGSVGNAVFGSIDGGVLFTAEGRARATALKTQAPQSAGALGRGLLLAAPVVLVFGGLLASGDAHFSLALHGFTSDLPTSVGHALRFALWAVPATLVAGGLWTYALRRKTSATESATSVLTQLGTTEGLTVLGSVALLFGAFLLVQARWLFSQDPSQPGTGLTYAHYARTGFFELSLVALLTWGLVETALRRVRQATTGSTTALRVLSAAVLGQAMVLLVSAHARLALYEDVYGFTLLRVYVHASIIFLGLSLLARLVTLFVAQQQTAGLVMLAAISVVAGLDVMNPEAVVVRANLGRSTEVMSVDWGYLASLSADAAPAIVEALAGPPVDQPQAERATRQYLCDLGHLPGPGGWTVSRVVARRLWAHCDIDLDP
jgi:hypothetical protein